MVDKQTNTGDLKVKLYFDENNRICSEIVFSDYDTCYVTENLEKNDNIEDFEQSINYNKIFTINFKYLNNLYRYNTSDIKEEVSIVNVNNYETFDHFKYNDFNKTSYNNSEAFKSYLSKTRLEKNFNSSMFFIDKNDMLYISVLNKIYEKNIDFSDGLIFVIDGLKVNKNIIYDFNKNNYQNSIILIDYDVINKEITDDYNNIRDIRSFYLNRNLIEKYFNILTENKYSWKLSLFLLIRNNYLDVFFF